MLFVGASFPRLVLFRKTDLFHVSAFAPLDDPEGANEQSGGIGLVFFGFALGIAFNLKWLQIGGKCRPRFQNLRCAPEPLLTCENAKINLPAVESV